jgi:hypothetical protein
MCLAVTKLNMEYVITVVMTADVLVFIHHVTSYAIFKSRPNCRARNQINKMLSAKVYTKKTYYGKIPNTISYHVIFRTSNLVN